MCAEGVRWVVFCFGDGWMGGVVEIEVLRGVGVLMVVVVWLRGVV